MLHHRCLRNRSSSPEVILGKGVLKICYKFTREHAYRGVISVKLLCNFIEITHRHGCSLVNLLHIFNTPFPGNTSGGLLLERVLNTALFKPFIRDCHEKFLHEKKKKKKNWSNFFFWTSLALAHKNNISNNHNKIYKNMELCLLCIFFFTENLLTVYSYCCMLK